MKVKYCTIFLLVARSTRWHLPESRVSDWGDKDESRLSLSLVWGFLGIFCRLYQLLSASLFFLRLYSSGRICKTGHSMQVFLRFSDSLWSHWVSGETIEPFCAFLENVVSAFKECFRASRDDPQMKDDRKIHCVKRLKPEISFPQIINRRKSQVLFFGHLKFIPSLRPLMSSVKCCLT